ncbi:MAG TPA: ABC transporter permease [Nitrospirota bacterium]|nr:ABC transporter permease [Nitrospirota bacterium]
MKVSAIRPIALVLSRELAMTSLLLLGVSLVVFTILYFSPGDPFSVLLEGQLSSADAQKSVREAIGIPKSWYAQYWAWLAGMFAGNFGTSIRTGMPVLSELIRTGLNTIVLTLGSLIITLVIALPIALYSAVRGIDRISWPFTMVAYIISALPVFWLAYMVIYFFTHKLGLFPLAFGFASGAKKWLYMLLPIFVLGVGNGTISEVIRFLRQEMGRVMAEDYIRTARAKGASVWRHAFKEGMLIPVTEIVASKIPFILGGAVIVEQVFNWPGMGRMAWQAAQDRDYPVIMGIAIVTAVIVRLGSLFQSVVYVAVNPRASKE